MQFNFIAAIVVGLVAIFFDVRTGRIPNMVTFGGALLALGYAMATGGVTGFAQASGAWLIGAALFFPIFALGGMGAGDVKLLAALAAWLGPSEAVWLAMFASIAGGVLGLFVAVCRGYLRQALANVWLMVTHWRVMGLRPVEGFTLRDTTAPRLAYAIPITIGVLCTLWRR